MNASESKVFDRRFALGIALVTLFAIGLTGGGVLVGYGSWYLGEATLVHGMMTGSAFGIGSGVAGMALGAAGLYLSGGTAAALVAL